MLAVAPPDSTRWGFDGLNPGVGELVSGGDSAFLNRILLELCKAARSMWDPLMAGVAMLYERLDSLDDVASMRLANVFAHHLNNTKFRWPYFRRWAEAFPTNEAMESSSNSAVAASSNAEDDDDDDEDEDLDREKRFLTHSLSMLAALNHSTPRLKQLLSSLGADLPPQLEAMLPASDIVVNMGGGLLGSDGLSEAMMQFGRDVIDRHERNTVDTAQRRFLVLAEQRSIQVRNSNGGDVGAGGPNLLPVAPSLPQSSIASDLRQFVEQYHLSAVEQPMHWRLAGFFHALLCLGSSFDLELSLTVRKTMALVEFHFSFLQDLLSGGDEIHGNSGQRASNATAAAAHGATLDTIVRVWGRSPPHMASLIVSLTSRGLFRPDLVLAWMAELGAGHPLALRSLPNSHTPLMLACDMVAAAAPFAWASEGGVVVVRGGFDSPSEIEEGARGEDGMSTAPPPPALDATVDAKMLLKQCAVTVLGSLASMASETNPGTDAMSSGGGGATDNDESEKLARACRSAARAVVRLCLGQRGLGDDAKAPLLDQTAVDSILGELEGAPEDFLNAVAPLRTFAA